MNQADKNASETTGMSSVTEQLASEPPVIENLRLFLPDKRKRVSSPGDNRRVAVIGAGIALVLVLFAWSGLSHRSPEVRSGRSARRQSSVQANERRSAPSDSLIPILDAARSSPEESPGSSVDAEQLARSASIKPSPSVPANLGAVPPFAVPHPWQAPPYNPAGDALADANLVPEREEARPGPEKLDKPSLVYAAREASFSESSRLATVPASFDREIRLPPGTRLRARLEAAVSSAVRAPVVAVVEYDYEQNGAILIPAGAKLIGRLEAADQRALRGLHRVLAGLVHVEDGPA